MLVRTLSPLMLFLQVFAIGIGSGVDKAELGRIASDSQHVFQVQNFDALNTLQAELKKTACQSKFDMLYDVSLPPNLVFEPSNEKLLVFTTLGRKHENILGKGENAENQHFLHYQQCFQ